MYLAYSVIRVVPIIITMRYVMLVNITTLRNVIQSTMNMITSFQCAI